MEQRKIIKLGPSSYAITLPASWVESNNISDLKFVNVKEHDTFLTVMTPRAEEKKEIIIYFDSLSLKIFNKLMISYYLKNYSKIIIKGEGVNTQFEQIKVYVDKLPHLEVISIEDKRLVLEDTARFEGSKIEDSFSTLENSLLSMLNCLEIKNVQEMYLKMQILDKSVNKTYFKCIKALNYYTSRRENFDIISKAVYYMKIATLYEKIGDNLKRVSRYLKRYIKDEQPVFDFGDITISLQLILKDIIEYRSSTSKNKSNILGHLNDKKMSILREIEERTEMTSTHYQVELVIFQFIKDTLGSFDEVIIANVDAYGFE